MPSPRLSDRSAHDATPNALSLALDAARAAGRTLYDLTVSNPTRAALPYDDDAILRALASPAALDYAPDALGLHTAREAIANDLRAHGDSGAEAAHIVLTASTSEAYSFVLKVLCDPGDDVLAPEPSYPLLAHLAALEGVRLTPYPLRYDGQWHIDVDALARARGPRTRAVLIVSPNNPTGSYVKRDELRAIAALGLPIVADEVFARYPLRAAHTPYSSAVQTPHFAAARTPHIAAPQTPHVAAPYVSAAHEASVLTFAMSGLSKLAGLPQLKLAFTHVAGPAADVRAALQRLELVGDTFLSVSAPIAHALPALLAARAATERAIHTRVRRNYAALRALVGDRSAATLLDAEAGWYACLRLPNVLSDEAWCLHFLEADGVIAQPGYFFDFADDAHIVISLLTEEAVFDAGAVLLVERVARVTQP